MADAYNFPDSLIDKFLNEILPNLINRLSSDGRVHSIFLYSNDSLAQNVGYGSKIKTVKIDSADVSSFAGLVMLTLSEPVENDVVVFYNPLFPFVSVDKIFKAYQSVDQNNYASAMGIDHSYTHLFKHEFMEMFDIGVFSVFRVSNFKKDKQRMHKPISAVGLKALELISLRQAEDYELYGLVINAGLYQ